MLLLSCRRFLLLLSDGVARLWLQLVGGAGQHQGVAWSGGATLLVDGHTQVALTGETLGVWVTERVPAEHSGWHGVPVLHSVVTVVVLTCADEATTW